MAKYSFKLKKAAVKDYLSGKGSYREIAQRYGVVEKRQVCTWVHAYQNFGEEGLRKVVDKVTYTFQFKLHVVELYLSSEMSYQEVAAKEKVQHPATIRTWVNAFLDNGPEALRTKKKGQKNALEHSQQKTKANRKKSSKAVNTSAEHVKELEQELLVLRIENAYLKELRRLRLEEEALLKKQRESSTVSEENSN